MAVGCLGDAGGVFRSYKGCVQAGTGAGAAAGSCPGLAERAVPSPGVALCLAPAFGSGWSVSCPGRAGRAAWAASPEARDRGDSSKAPGAPERCIGTEEIREREIKAGCWTQGVQKQSGFFSFLLIFAFFCKGQVYADLCPLCVYVFVCMCVAAEVSATGLGEPLAFPPHFPALQTNFTFFCSPTSSALFLGARLWDSIGDPLSEPLLLSPPPCRLSTPRLLFLLLFFSWKKIAINNLDWNCIKVSLAMPKF